MNVIRKHITKDQFQLYEIPADFGEEAEIIILAVNPRDKEGQLTDEELFYAENNDLLIGEDKSEDELWSKYL